MANIDGVVAIIRLGEVCRAWNEARLAALLAKAERDGAQCEREELGGDERDGYAPGVEPCWRTQVYPEGNQMRLEDRCDSCQRNAAAHARYNKLRQIEAGKRRSMQNLANKLRTEA